VEEVSKRAFSIGEIATKSDVSPAFIYQQIADKKLRAVKIGRRTVVLDQDWKAWLNAMPEVVAKPRAKRGAAA
jgi:hypothetical protein